jgi:hypothetical protein
MRVWDEENGEYVEVPEEEKPSIWKRVQQMRANIQTKHPESEQTKHQTKHADEQTKHADDQTKHTAGERFSQEERRAGGQNRAKKLSPERRHEIAQKAAQKRWAEK